MSETPPTDSPPDGAPRRSAHWIVQAAVGAAIGLQLSSLFRLGARLGLGTPLDDAIFGAVGLALVVVGALLFLGWARTALGRSVAAPLCSAIALANLAVVAGITTPLGFQAHCARFGTDPSLAGTPYVNATVAAVLFVAPAFATGALLVSIRGTAERVATFLGLTAGWSLWGHALDAVSKGGLGEELAASGSAGLVALGAGACGAVLVLSQLSGCAADALPGTRRVHAIRTLGSAALVAAALLVHVSPLAVYPPWQRFRVVPDSVTESSRGQLTVLPAQETDQGAAQQVLLDQRPLTPAHRELGLEAACLASAIELWRTAGGQGQPRTLAIGRRTVAREAMLKAAGVDGVLLDDSAPVDPDAGYDLAFTWPVGAYLTAGWDLSVIQSCRADVKVAWLPGDMPPQATWDGARLVLAADGLRALAFGLMESTLEPVAGDVPAADHPVEVTPLSLDWLQIRPDARPLQALERVMKPLKGQLERGLGIHAAAQRIGSPFESPLERIVLDDEALAIWRDHALGTPTGVPVDSATGLQRQLIEGAADVLVAQADVGRFHAFIAPVARAHPGSERLQIASAWAEAEALDHSAAAARLRPLHAARPDDRGIARRLARALVALDDPEGRSIAQGLLRDTPEDPELFGLAQGLRGMRSIGQSAGGYEGLTQAEALSLASGAFLGTIVDAEVREVDAGDGGSIFLTALTVRGTGLAPASGASQEEEHEVVFFGGFVDDERGTFNSSAPPAHRTRIGRRVFYYYESQVDLPGGMRADALLRGDAGLFTAFESPSGDLIVQGRGNNAAIPNNLRSDELPWPSR
ncbi:MAG: hypothetical protein AAGG01_02705 [Planctomycetota bacterium]